MKKHNIRSRRELARRANLSSSHVTRIIRHGIIPGHDVVRSIALALGEDVNTALEIAGITMLSDLPGDLPPEMKSGLRRLMRLPAEERAAIWAGFELDVMHAEERMKKQNQNQKIAEPQP